VSEKIRLREINPTGNHNENKTYRNKKKSRSQDEREISSSVSAIKILGGAKKV